MRFLLLSLTMIFIVGCGENGGEILPPSDHPYFPSAILQGSGANENTLYVFSSNFDRRYKHGSVLSVDLSKVDTEIASSREIIGADAVKSSGFIPGFVDGASITLSNDRLLFLSREFPSLRSIALDSTGLLSCPGQTSLLGQDCFSAPAALTLSQYDPYFLNLFHASQDLTGGIIGYLLEPMAQKASDTGVFALPQYFEFERFTWNTPSSTAKITEQIPLGEILKKAELPTYVIGSHRMISKIASLTTTTFDGYLYMLVGRPPMSIHLVRIALSDLQNTASGAIPMARYDLGTAGKITSLSAMAIRESGSNIEIFIANEVPGNIVKYSMPKIASVDVNGILLLTEVASEWTCDFPNDLKLSPDAGKLVVACNSGKILVHDADTLTALYRDPDAGAVFGRVPTKIHFDTRFQTSPFRFYTTNFHDGSLSIYELSNTASQLLSRKGHIFQPAPRNRIGGSK